LIHLWILGGSYYVAVLIKCLNLRYDRQVTAVIRVALGYRLLLLGRVTSLLHRADLFKVGELIQGQLLELGLRTANH